MKGVVMVVDNGHGFIFCNGLRLHFATGQAVLDMLTPKTLSLVLRQERNILYGGPSLSSWEVHPFRSTDVGAGKLFGTEIFAQVEVSL